MNHNSLTAITYGGWSIAILKSLQGCDFTLAPFEPYDPILEAARIGVLLSSVRALGAIAQPQLETYRKLAGLRTKALATAVPSLESRGAVRIGGSLHEVTGTFECLLPTASDVLRVVGELVQSAVVVPRAMCAIVVLDLTSAIPTPREALMTRISAFGFGELDIDGAMQDLINFGILQQTRETELGSAVLYNPKVCTQPDVDLFKALSALNPAERQQAQDAIEHATRRPGMPFPSSLSRQVIDVLTKLGILDLSGIMVRGGAKQATFPTAPQLWGRFAVLGEAEQTRDVLNDAKLFLSSLRYGQLGSEKRRGQIDDISILLDRLINRGYVGSATAIGEDYPLPMTQGIVSVVPDPQKPGQYYLNLEKEDVAEAVRDVLSENHSIVPDSTVPYAKALEKVAAYESPDAVRVRTRVSPGLLASQEALMFQLRSQRPRR